jgi:hypothetical protein
MISTSLLFLGSALPLVLAATYEVQVGPNNDFVYEPAYIAAQAGDTVNFVLYVRISFFIVLLLTTVTVIPRTTPSPSLLLPLLVLALKMDSEPDCE